MHWCCRQSLQTLCEKAFHFPCRRTSSVLERSQWRVPAVNYDACTGANWAVNSNARQSAFIQTTTYNLRWLEMGSKWFRISTQSRAHSNQTAVIVIQSLSNSLPIHFCRQIVNVEILMPYGSEKHQTLNPRNAKPRTRKLLVRRLWVHI